MASTIIRGWLTLTSSPSFTRTVSTVPGMSGAQVAGVVLVGLEFPVLQNLQGLIQHLQLPEDAVDLEGQHAIAFLVGIGHADELDQNIAAFTGLQDGLLSPYAGHRSRHGSQGVVTSL